MSDERKIALINKTTGTSISPIIGTSSNESKLEEELVRKPNIVESKTDVKDIHTFQRSTRHSDTRPQDLSEN